MTSSQASDAVCLFHLYVLIAAAKAGATHTIRRVHREKEKTGALRVYISPPFCWFWFSRIIHGHYRDVSEPFRPKRRSSAHIVSVTCFVHLF
jgi:hypothetical protein